METAFSIIKFVPVSSAVTQTLFSTPPRMGYRELRKESILTANNMIKEQTNNRRNTQTITARFYQLHRKPTSTTSNPHFSLTSFMTGSTACRSVVEPQVFRINLYLDMNILLSLENKNRNL